MKFIDEKLEKYAISKSTLPSSVCDELQMYTQSHVEMSMMLTGKMEMSFVGFLIHSLQVKKILELGTYTGYSALAMAENLPADGEVLTLDISPEYSQIAKKYWSKSSHGKKIKQILAPAMKTLEELKEKFDLIFIDADKENYMNYFKRSLELLSDSGIIVVDNVLWSGRVLEAKTDQEASTKAICVLNDFIANNESLYATLLPIRDGIFIVRKRS